MLSKIESQRLSIALWLSVASIFLSLSISVGIFFTLQNGVEANRALALTTQASLCSLRVGHEESIADSRAFLKQFPAGIPGIPVAFIQQGIDREQRIITALSNLNCSEK